MSIVALDAVFGHHRGNPTTNDYLTVWRHTFDEASSLAGLQLNDVGQSYDTLRNSRLLNQMKGDIEMHVAGGLVKYSDIMTLMQCMSTCEQASPSSSVPATARKLYGENNDDQQHADCCNDGYWKEDNNGEDEEYDAYYQDDEWYDYDYENGDETYYGDDAEYHPDYGGEEHGGDREDYQDYDGRGKGRGKRSQGKRKGKGVGKSG